jgi:preprotein translocase subunit SecA
VELRELLLAQARKFDDARIQARADECLAAGREMDAVDTWLKHEYQTPLTNHDRKSFASDSKGIVAARIREALRSELSHFERWIMLQTIDNAWKDHLRSMDQIRDAIGFRAFSQKDPRIEFKKESSRLYIEMMESVQNRLSEVLLKGELMPQMPQSQAPAPQSPAPQDSQVANAAAANQAPVVVTQVASKRAASASSDMSAVVGRNELCPCGSGKKFKHCHGSKDAAAAQEQSL